MCTFINVHPNGADTVFEFAAGGNADRSIGHTEFNASWQTKNSGRG